MWHHRLNHIGEDRINKLEKDEILGSLNLESYPACESCLQKKMTKLSFVGHGERATDVCRSFDVQVRGCYSYFIIFIDDLSRYGYVHLMKHKSETFKKFKKYRNEVEK